MQVKTFFYKYFLRFVPDSVWVRFQFRRKLGCWPNLKNPKTFNEKSQWLKLHVRNPFYTKLADKFSVREYIKEIIGKDYLIPLFGVWDKFDDIDFEKLPNQFVLKCTHDSGGLVICTDKAKFDINAARNKISNSLKFNYYWAYREWPYKNVKPRIIAEKYIEDTCDNELRDYKLYTFNGIPRFLLIATGRKRDLHFDYFDMDGNHLKIPDTKALNNPENTPHLPKNFDKMKELASCLGKNFPYVRVDFYEADGKIFFGEITFFDDGGYMKATPPIWEYEWGKLIKLPEAKV